MLEFLAAGALWAPLGAMFGIFLKHWLDGRRERQTESKSRQRELLEELLECFDAYGNFPTKPGSQEAATSWYQDFGLLLRKIEALRLKVEDDTLRERLIGYKLDGEGSRGRAFKRDPFESRAVSPEHLYAAHITVAKRVGLSESELRDRLVFDVEQVIRAALKGAKLPAPTASVAALRKVSQESTRELANLLLGAAAAGGPLATLLAVAVDKSEFPTGPDGLRLQAEAIGELTALIRSPGSPLLAGAFADEQLDSGADASGGEPSPPQLES